jgi:hypothetical protein
MNRTYWASMFFVSPPHYLYLGPKIFNMKKIVLIASLVTNIIVVSFLFMSFKGKPAMKTDSGGYLIVRTMEGFGKLSVTDGNSIMEEVKINKVSGLNSESFFENNKIICNKLNDIRSKGYELVAANNSINGGISDYVFLKK